MSDAGRYVLYKSVNWDTFEINWWSDIRDIGELNKSPIIDTYIGNYPERLQSSYSYSEFVVELFYNHWIDDLEIYETLDMLIRKEKIRKLLK